MYKYLERLTTLNNMEGIDNAKKEAIGIAERDAIGIAKKRAIGIAKMKRASFVLGLFSKMVNVDLQMHTRLNLNTQPS
jgi:hypothetical protein